MGQTTSNITSRFRKWATGQGSTEDANEQCLARATCNPFIYKRISQMFIDRDGEVAHEFYEQQRITYRTPNGRKRKSRLIMRKIPKEELTPLEMEDLPHPAINVNYPLILCEASMVRPA